MHLVEGDLASADVVALLQSHISDAVDESPPESVHALDVEGLIDSNITFWSVRAADEALLGFGALKHLDATTGEVKSMRTDRQHLGKGAGSCVLEHIIQVARQRGYTQLLLETGSSPAYAPAHALYAKFGFAFCGPFAEYREDPYSRYMSLQL